jgi:hypothetical protein
MGSPWGLGCVARRGVRKGGQMWVAGEGLGEAAGRALPQLQKTAARSADRFVSGPGALWPPRPSDHRRDPLRFSMWTRFPDTQELSHASIRTLLVSPQFVGLGAKWGPSSLGLQSPRVACRSSQARPRSHPDRAIRPWYLGKSGWASRAGRVSARIFRAILSTPHAAGVLMTIFPFLLPPPLGSEFLRGS